MRTLKRNHITVFYALLTGETEAVDEFGNYTGETELTFTDPVCYRQFSYGPRRGVVTQEPFGLSNGYVQPLVTTDMHCPVKASTRLWIGKCPYDADGGLQPHTHVVEAVIPSINSIRVLCKEVSVS